MSKGFLVCAVLAAVIAICGCGGSGQLAAAHTAITSGCVTGAEYAGSHPDTVSDIELDGFEDSCRDAVGHIENWLVTEDAGVDGGTHDAS